MKYLVIQEIPKLKCFAGLQPEVFVQPLLLKKDRFALALVSASPGPEHWDQLFQSYLREMDAQCHGNSECEVGGTTYV